MASAILSCIWQRLQDFLTCILLIGYVRYEECVKIKQARLDWPCLLAACQYIDRFACLAYHGGKGILSVQTLSLSKV